MTQNERMSLPIWKKVIILIISIIVFLIQVFILFILFDVSFTYSYSNIRWIYFLTLAIGVLYVLYILSKPMSVHYKLTWCILILIFPLPFCLLYSLNSSSRRLSKRKQNIINNTIKNIKVNDSLSKLLEEDKIGGNIVKAVQHNIFYPVWDNSKYTYFSDCNNKFNDLLEELKLAKSFIYIEFFIIADGLLMTELYPILKQKGEDGVEIKILYDDIGSKGVMTRKLLKKISEIPNCKINNYEPLGLNFNLLVNYRDHRKIFIIDGKIAYCGGDNLADEYIHKKIRFGHWRDNCGKFEGKIVDTFTFMFGQMWYISTKEKIEEKTYNNSLVYENNGYMLAFGDGPLNNANPAYDLFQSLIASAREYIYISTPYFIIDDSMIDLLCLKIKSGVKVVLLTPGIPDKKTVFYMTRANYRKILLAGGLIYEYSNGFNHAKNIIVDDKYAFIGTVNMDYRSLFLHYECGALIINNPEILKMQEDFLSAVNTSTLIEYDTWKKRPWYQKIFAYILNFLAPML